MEPRYGTSLRLRSQSAADRNWFNQRDKARLKGDEREITARPLNVTKPATVIKK